MSILAGCGPTTSSLELTSYKDPYFPERFNVQFTQCAYRVCPGGDYEIVGRASRAPTKPDGQPIVQLLSVHIFWKPNPGKTFDDPSGIDATLKYVIASDSGVAVFEGAGFVYAERKRGSDRLQASLESGQLHLTSKVGDPPELLGETRVVGRLNPKEDSGEAIEMLRELELRASGALAD